MSVEDVMSEPFARERVLAREWLLNESGLNGVVYADMYAESLARLLHRYGEECRQAVAEEKRAKGKKR